MNGATTKAANRFFFTYYIADIFVIIKKKIKMQIANHNFILPFYVSIFYSISKLIKVSVEH